MIIIIVIIITIIINIQYYTFIYSLFYCHIFGPNPMAPDLPVVPGPQRSQHCCYRCSGATDLFATRGDDLFHNQFQWIEQFAASDATCWHLKR